MFTPEAWAKLSVMPGFGRALDADYLFIDAAGNPRVALPRRSTDFERLINSGNIFERGHPPLSVEASLKLPCGSSEPPFGVLVSAGMSVFSI